MSPTARRGRAARPRQLPRPETSSGAAESAASVGLRYVSDDRPGIKRAMGPLGFKYIGADGRRIRAAAELRRIRALAVPPAWTDVWICPDPNGHLQATGRDARGRKQYRYHPRWRACRDETKYDHMQAFAAALPAIRERTRRDLDLPGLPRAKVLAAVVQLLEKSLIRVGNEEYARLNGSFGLTTMRDKHVNVKGEAMRFEFKGKSGIRHAVRVDDRRLAGIVKKCRDLPGQELFQYIDEEGRRQDVDSADVNAYVKEITGEPFTAKDFRTWAGTVLAATALLEYAPVDSKAKATRNLLQAIDAVAGVLGNTRSVCRKSYIHPAIVDAYFEGSLHGRRKRPARRRPAAALRREELFVLEILRKRPARQAA